MYVEDIVVENVEYRQLVVGSISHNSTLSPVIPRQDKAEADRTRGGGSQAGRSGGNTTRKQKQQREPELFREGRQGETSESMYSISISRYDSSSWSYYDLRIVFGFLFVQFLDTTKAQKNQRQYPPDIFRMAKDPAHKA